MNFINFAKFIYIKHTTKCYLDSVMKLSLRMHMNFVCFRCILDLYMLVFCCFDGSLVFMALFYFVEEED